MLPRFVCVFVGVLFNSLFIVSHHCWTAVQYSTYERPSIEQHRQQPSCNTLFFLVRVWLEQSTHRSLFSSFHCHHAAVNRLAHTHIGSFRCDVECCAFISSPSSDALNIQQQQQQLSSNSLSFIPGSITHKHFPKGYAAVVVTFKRCSIPN